MLTLSPSTLTALHTRLHPFTVRDFLTTLPQELAVAILTWTDACTVARVERVCRAWQRVARESAVWRGLCWRRGWRGDVEGYTPTYPLDAATHGHAHLEPAIDWRHVYRRRTQLNRHWQDGRYATRVFSGHTAPIYCLQFDREKIISGSRDTTLRVWDMQSGQCQRTLRGHGGSVVCLQYSDRYIVSGASDGCLIVWDVRTGEALRVLRGHAETVLNVRFDGRAIVSCSRDSTIKLWRTEPEPESLAPFRTLVGHRAAVNAVQYHGDTIVSGSGDRVIKVWSASTGQLLRNLLGHTRGIACLHFDGTTLVSGSSDATLRIWDVHKGVQLRLLRGHTDLVRSVAFDADRIVSASYDGTVRMWSRETGREMWIVRGRHTERIFKVGLSEGRLVTGAKDRCIIVWEFTHGLDG
ncbi:hypothetical protein CXG81DRAFT_10549 [Caulochytrium protostelioides]|uniref:F-box domain-containing protein n=1 Tax=Caulochytrium protostelioides TaxID=1555241 RepID=A0A4V1IV33_9FUNG|nr:hypothetical protein CXG81DRAFT_10549 [Caulochytrium protostelioides]|eukprot:RKP02659.1 hypothetical protein CXG81DRAFT_10549 [Caulochytrium protostelioides]